LQVCGGKRAGFEQAKELECGIVIGRAEEELAGGVAAGIGERVDARFADFAGEWDHAAEDFAERGAVVLRDPAAEVDEFGCEDRLLVDEAEDFFERAAWGRVVKFEDEAGEFARAEGDEYATAGLDTVLEGFEEAVGEGLVEGDGQADVAVEHR